MVMNERRSRNGASLTFQTILNDFRRIFGALPHGAPWMWLPIISDSGHTFVEIPRKFYSFFTTPVPSWASGVKSIYWARRANRPRNSLSWVWRERGEKKEPRREKKQFVPFRLMGISKVSGLTWKCSNRRFLERCDDTHTHSHAYVLT